MSWLSQRQSCKFTRTRVLGAHETQMNRASHKYASGSGTHDTDSGAEAAGMGARLTQGCFRLNLKKLQSCLSGSKQLELIQGEAQLFKRMQRSGLVDPVRPFSHLRSIHLLH